MAAMALSLARRRARAAWLFILPMILVLTLVAGWPLIRTIAFSFTDATFQAGRIARFVGLDNYLFYGPNRADYDDELGGYYIYYEPKEADLVWKSEDGRFHGMATGAPVDYDVDTAGIFRWQGLLVDPGWWRSVWNTVVFTLVSVSIETALGLVIALTLNASLPGRGVLRAAVLIPWAIPTIVSAKMWGWMLNDQYGVINEVLLALGLIDGRIAWTAVPGLALPTVVAVDVWKTTPFMALLILAALQLLPHEIYEAARIDDIGPWTRFRRITLPLIAPALAVAILFRMLDALRIFDLIYVLTPNSADTTTMSIFAKQQSIDFSNVGFGSAAATLLFLVIATVTALYMVVGRVRLDDGGDRG
jgi:trehalose/maltose transport system permease protein